LGMSPIPKVRDNDPEDVSWALSTAATQFARGDREEALKWLRRAAEAASEAEHDKRALELAKAAADLASAPKQIMTPKAPPTQLKASPKIAARPVPEKSKPTKPAAKAKPDDTAKRGAVRAKQRSSPNLDDITDAEVIHTPDPDAWPTESMGQTELDALSDVYGQERTRIGALPYRPEAEDDAPSFRASQAVHVIVWREADGTLRVAPRGTAVSAVTIEALLVAPSPDVDLLAWLSPA
jgi:hypothetical protein